MSGKAVILSACRTAGGKLGGQFSKLEATDLGGVVLSESLARSGVEAGDVSEAIMGNGWQAGVGANPARVALFKAGIAMTVPAFTVNIRCGSGLRAVMLAADRIRLGDANAMLAGGMESASNAPYILKTARWGFRMGEQRVSDVLHADGFLCPISGKLMGEITDIGVAREFSITRAEQDEFSYNSHMKAAAAIEKGYFKEEIVPVVLRDKKKGDVVCGKDENPRGDTTVESLSRLPAIFVKEGGTITAGSSSALCDAASALVLADAQWAKAKGFTPLAEIVSYSVTSLDADHFPIAPVAAMKNALSAAGMTIGDMDLIELNEAFAAQVIACLRLLPFDTAKLNVCGGAIALGHPIGATGAKILTTLLHALKREKKEWGMASACIGGGQGVAMIVRMPAGA
ncbi:MAG: thiolase family protein [Synergistaceae bacterium]|jgi:acetyl-CoA C-acetyltransferase|nr:thiolase family protein [Synergistaceae bacterium]